MDRTTIDLLQGTLGDLIPTSVSRAPLHGYGIARWIEEVTGDEVLIEDGPLDPALHRLQAMNLLTSEWGVSESGRRVKRYTITEQGRAQLRAETNRWQRFSGAASKALGRGRESASANPLRRDKRAAAAARRDRSRRRRGDRGAPRASGAEDTPGAGPDRRRRRGEEVRQ